MAKRGGGELGVEVLGVGFGELGVGGVGWNGGGGEEAFPEALGDRVEGGEGFELAFGLGGAEVGQAGWDVGIGEEVGLEGEGVGGGVDLACGPGGEAEDGGAAEAPVGDEERAGGAEFWGEVGKGELGRRGRTGLGGWRCGDRRQ